MRTQLLLFPAILAVAALALLPGIGGPFLFDDLPNLAALDAVHADGTAYGLAQYVVTGASSSLGRPLALLSFAAQAASWSSDPGAFIRVNILLHLLNGALWFGIVLQLQKLRAVPGSALLAPAAMALWLLMPIHGSAVLYVVQRMTVLAVTLVMAGLLAYLLGRRAAMNGRPRTGLALMSVGLLVATGLGTLAKEIAALTPMLILLLEYTLLRGTVRPAYWRIWSSLFLWAPVATVLAYLALKMPGFLAGYDARTFTLGERLLTQGRVLFSYLLHAFVPESSVRLLHDDIPLSTGLLDPWTTLPALLGWIALAALAVPGWRRWPILAFGIGWYLIGHLLESTLIPLELAFDHRSYLPLLGVTLALAAWMAQRLQSAAPRIRVLIGAGSLGYLTLLATHAWLAASLWANPVEQARQWVQRQPDSVRAAHYYGVQLAGHGRVGQARSFYAAARQRWPDDMVLAISHFGLGCFHEGAGIPLAEVQAAVLRDRGAERALGAGAARQLVERIGHGQCPGLTAADGLALLGTMLQSPRLTTMHLPLHHARALLLAETGRTMEALQQLDLAIEIDASVPLLQQAIWWSVQLDDPHRAARYLETLETTPRIPARTRHVYRKEIHGMRKLIELYESLPSSQPS